MHTSVHNLPPKLDRKAEAELALAFRRARVTLLRALLRAPGGLEALDPSGMWKAAAPTPGAGVAAVKAFLRLVRGTPFGSPELCGIARELAPQLAPVAAADLHAKVERVEALRGTLVEGSLVWILKAAQRFSFQTRRGWTADFVEELFQQGCLHLIDAIERFDPRKACLETFCNRFALKDAFLEVFNSAERATEVGKSAISDWNEVTAVKRGIQLREGREPGREEVAGHLGWKTEKIDSVLGAFKSSLSLDGARNDEMNGEGCWIERYDIGQVQEDGFDLDSSQRTTAILRAIDSLPGLQRDLIEMKLDGGKDGQPVNSMRVMARRLGVSTAVAEAELARAKKNIKECLHGLPVFTGAA